MLGKAFFLYCLFLLTYTYCQYSDEDDIFDDVRYNPRRCEQNLRWGKNVRNSTLICMFKVDVPRQWRERVTAARTYSGSRIITEILALTNIPHSKACVVGGGTNFNHTSISMTSARSKQLEYRIYIFGVDV